MPCPSPNIDRIPLEQSTSCRPQRLATSIPRQNDTNEVLLEHPVLPTLQANGNTRKSEFSQEISPEPSLKSQEQPFHAAITQDMQAVIKRIVHHSEHVDSHYASQSYNEMGTVDTESFLPLGASLHLKTQSLPILDNLVSCPMKWSMAI